MATEIESVGETIKINYGGEIHELIVRVRNDGSILAEPLSRITIKTVALWLKVLRAIKEDDWSFEKLAADYISPEYEELGESRDAEPYVTVFNKAFIGLSITIHSNSNGMEALSCAAAILAAKDELRNAMPQLFQDSPKKPEFPTIPVKRGDVSDTADEIARDSDMPQNQAKRVFIRKMRKGDMQGTVDLESGAADKKTWKMALLATKLYSVNEIQYNAGTTVVYPIVGAIEIKQGRNDLYFDIPVPEAHIHIGKRGAAEHGGKLIDSDWMKLKKHLNITNDVPQGLILDPPCYIALKAGKVTKDKETGQDIQFKNYIGLYREE